MSNLRSVSVGVWVNAGSVYESGADGGISHFIEHMAFKGTARRSAADIAAEMDAVGGNLNAFTAKECTCFYAKVLDEDLPLAVDMLADITLHPALDAQEMEKEKRVNKVEDVMNLGDKVLVRVIEIDPKTGKISLDRKGLLPEDETKDS